MVGDLTLTQRQPIPDGARLRLLMGDLPPAEGGLAPLNFSVIQPGGLDVESLSWRRIAGDYAALNVRAELAVGGGTGAPLWSHGRAVSEPFTLTARIYVPSQRVAYVPGLGEVLKHGWLQYVAYFVLVAVVLWPLWCLLVRRVLDMYVVVDYVHVSSDAKGAGVRPYEF